MTHGQSAEILGIGMTTPVGLSAASTAAAIRAGITRIKESTVYDRRGDPIRLGLVGEEYLPPLEASLEALQELTAWHRRMLRLATLALGGVSEGWRRMPPPPLLLAMPGPHPDGREPSPKSLLEHLVAQTGVELDLRRSKLIREGRAGALLALQQALDMLNTHRLATVCVGGVDTYFDLDLLDALDARERLLHARGPSDGFIPGEGAAFLLLGSPGTGKYLKLNPIARITGVGIGTEKGHLSSEEPHRGDGLADTFRTLFASHPANAHKVRCVYAGLNGENFWAKEWGVAYLRNSRHFEPDHSILHPIEYIGDPGAALGAILMGVAAIGIQRQYRPSPCLVWCASDGEARAATLVQAA
jgi:3-oxoacyl-[acyl-carrier-protein] synthase-1